MAIHERNYMISGDLINEIIASNTIRDQDVQDRVVTKLETLVRDQDERMVPTAVEDAPNTYKQRGHGGYKRSGF